MTTQHEEMPLDVLFVGGGPANLAGAIRLMQLVQEKNLEIEVGLIEKGDAIGAHCLSGAIVDPRALAELLPDYRQKGCPLEQERCTDQFRFLTVGGSFSMPYTPPYMHNAGCHVISLSRFCRWLAEIAEEMGVMIFPGFAGGEILYGEDGRTVTGVRTVDKGVDRNGEKKSNFEPGVDLTARVTIFGEGPKGSLLRELHRKLGLFSDNAPQTFETAVKEVIELPADSAFLASDTTVVHTLGYPLGLATKGGGFLYRMQGNRIACGLVVGLDYRDSMLEPYRAFLQYKHHPFIADMIQGGKVIQQGAKTLSSGGYLTMPRLAVDGALIVGDSASMLNPQRLKGIHTAMKSGMLAAEATVSAIEKDDTSEKILAQYPASVSRSWIHAENYPARNFSQALSKPGLAKFIHIAAQHLTGGRGFKDPMPIEADWPTLKPMPADKRDAQAATPPGVDGTLYVDKLTGVYLSGTQHEEDQPCHLAIGDLRICEEKCYEKYGNPCTRFCPGSVYEIIDDPPGNRQLKLNPSNCLHCKTCEIKDPYQNIIWNCPEGGGPNYTVG
ncbi:MAG: electron transfer flavoprotein-ubiquinone oxidoreductase [Deltaproteobacteria bacterium]|nr:MAG: electron transfer flavoprotein-ubiquinone oxidoreductase [Deltaproteobacteria bacterium]